MKKSAGILAGILAGSMLLAGCSGSGRDASNEYVTVKDYKGIEVPKVEGTRDVKSEEVDAYIESMLEQNATQEEVKGRPVEKGDTAVIDFVGKVGGEEFEGGSGNDYPLEIGSGTFIEGFEDSVVGHNAGDAYDWNGKFPDGYPEASLAGKDVVFTITVKSISKVKKAKLTDDFVKTVSEKSKTVKEYKKEVKKLLKENAENNYTYALQDAAWSAVLDKAEVKKYPKGEVKAFTEKLIKQYKDAAEANGVGYEEFIKGQANMEVKEFEKQAEEAAKSSIKQSLVGKAIADKEKLTPSKEEFEKEFKKMAKQYGYESVKDLKKAADEDTLKDMVIRQRVSKWLADSCVQVVADDTEK